MAKLPVSVISIAGMVFDRPRGGRTSSLTTIGIIAYTWGNPGSFSPSYERSFPRQSISNFSDLR